MSTPSRAPRASAGPGGVRRLLTRPWLGGLAFAALEVAAVAVGLATRPQGTSLTLAWPAAAVGFCWLATAWGSPRRARWTTLAIAVASGVLALATGTSLVVTAAFAVASAGQAVVACGASARWQRRTSGPRWTLRRSSDLTGLVVAACAGSATVAGTGALTLHLATGAPVAPTAVAWFVPNSVSTLAFVAVALRLADPSLPRVFRDRRQAVEAALVATVVVGAYTVVLGTHVALAFVLLPLSLWIALRFETTVSALHTMVVGAVVVLLTRQGWGFSAGEAATTRVLVAQAYVAVAGLVSLVLALHRDERQQLVVESQQAHARADRQAEILGSVLATMAEGVVLVDAEGRFLVRNAAAAALVGPVASPDGRIAPPEHYGMLSPGGRPVTRRQMADVRALAGEHVEEDYVVQLGPGRRRTLSVRATPLTTSRGERQALMILADVTSRRRAAREVAEARDLFSAVLAAADEFAIVATDLDFAVTLFNTGAERMLGYEAAEVVGGALLRLHDPAEVAARARELGIPADAGDGLAAAVHARAGTRQWTYVRRDGSGLQVSLTVSAMRDRTGAVTGYMGLARDVTAQLAAEADLADSEERFRLTFATAPVGMMLLSLGAEPGTVLQVNAAMPALLGHTEADVVDAPVTRFCHPDEVGPLLELLTAAGTGGVGEGVQADRRFVHADGHTVWARTSVSVARPRRGEAYAICLVEDVTARKLAEQALTHQALHDALTGLPNRTLFADRLSHALAAAGRSGDRVGVLVLDLDGFKAVNDSVGHAAGDELLQRVAERLGDSVRPGDTVARLGGDEFAVVCPVLGTPDEATAVAHLRTVGERIVDALRTPFDLRAGTVAVGVSVGVVAAAAGTPDAEVVHAADEAMYAAKRGGKNRVSVHGESGRPAALAPVGAAG